MTQPTATNIVTCAFGVPGEWEAGYHTGIDYRAPVGTKIHATRGGTVVFAGRGAGGFGEAYGKHVIVQVRYRFVTRQVLYAHLNRIRVVPGQKVVAGEVIGRAGETGNTQGAHLHYEERKSPYNYWSHYKPVLQNWKPRNKRVLKEIYDRIGISI